MAKANPLPDGSVVEATERAIAAARHLTEMDAGAVAVLRKLAATIDAGRDPEAPFDNVTIPTYLRYAEQLGLTSAGRLKLDPKAEKQKGKLGELRSIAGGRAS